MIERTSKQYRQEIYGWIENYIGEIPFGAKSYLSKMLQEYVKHHNKVLTKTNNELFEALNEKGRLIDELRKKKLRNKHNKKTHINSKPLILE